MKKIIGEICLISVLVNLLQNSIQVSASTTIIEKVIRGESIYNSNVEESTDKLSIEDENIELSIGQSSKLDVNYESKIYTKEQLIWNSSNKDVVKINQGELVAINEGQAIIEVQSYDKQVQDECVVNVTRGLDESVMQIDNEELSKYPLVSGMTYEINNNTDKSIFIRQDYNSDTVYYNIICYNSNGSIDYSRINDWGYIYLQPGKRIEISFSKGAIDSYILINSEYEGLVRTINTPVFNSFEFDEWDSATCC